MEIPYAEPYKIKMVEPIRPSTRHEREQWIKEAHYNLFNLRSEQVFIDLLTDSGTGAMSHHQWAAMMQADESYAGASSYYRLKESVSSLTGFEYFLPTHQGRAAENVLFSALIKEGDIIPGNSHFDTTKGHIEFRKARAIDCTVDEAKDTSNYFPFKGNVCLTKLEKTILEHGAEKIPFILITITNNSAGGQPVSMENIKQVKSLANRYGIMLCFDGARFAENAYFIKLREQAYAEKSIREIVLEMFGHGDAMTMSSKKDGYVNMGGFIAMRNASLFEKASSFNILFEGYLTYGGMSGRDMDALATGLYEGTSFEILDARIKQTAYLGELLDGYGIPVQHPYGGHAIFVNANAFLPHLPKEEFVAQTLAVELYKEAGVRAVEIGTLLADRDPVTRENRYPAIEFLRLAIPRRTYTNNHMQVVAAALKNVYDRREDLKSGYRIVHEAPLMRHFTVKLEKL
ncbi:MAG: tryptophanase [Bacteroidota bacterium]|nr:MAG: tryptophanase [Bacteroidota bacterium]